MTQRLGRILVVGYTGETGKALLNALPLADTLDHATLCGRRDIDLPEALKSKATQTRLDFENVPMDLMKNHDHVICLLGTTRGKSGAEGFIKIDKDYVLNVARAAREANVPHFHLMTSQGSNANSMFLYPKTKGQVEDACAELNFDKLTIYQPGLLLCDRQENRLGERIAQCIAKPLFSMLGASSGSIPCDMVAHAMLQSAMDGKTGKLPNKTLQEMSKSFLANFSKM